MPRADYTEHLAKRIAIKLFQRKGVSTMSLYSLLLFVHVSGAVCLFAGMGTWLFGSIAMARAARVEQVRAIADLMLSVRLLVPAGALLVITAGVAMTWLSWGFQTGWIVVALASLGIIGPTGTWLIDPKVRETAALAHTLPDGPVPAPLAKRACDRLVRIALHTLIGMLFGIVFLMTAKPQLVIAIGAVAASALLGWATALPLLRSQLDARPHRYRQKKQHRS